MKIDKDNKRIKRAVDSTIIELAKIHDEHIDKTYNKDDLENIKTLLEEMNSNLNKIDNNITDIKMKVTAEVRIREFLNNNNKTLDNLSATFIGSIFDNSMENMLDTETHNDDFYDEILTNLWIVESLCDIYFRNTSVTDSNVDFKEVEKEYE